MLGEVHLKPGIGSAQSTKLFVSKCKGLKCVDLQY